MTEQIYALGNLCVPFSEVPAILGIPRADLIENVRRGRITISYRRDDVFGTVIHVAELLSFILRSGLRTGPTEDDLVEEVLDNLQIKGSEVLWKDPRADCAITCIFVANAEGPAELATALKHAGVTLPDHQVLRLQERLQYLFEKIMSDEAHRTLERRLRTAAAKVA